MITTQQIEVLYKLYPQVKSTSGDIAYDANGNEVTYDLQAVTSQAQKDACKSQAKSLLAASDWAILTDVPLDNKAEFKSYRETLRNLVLNPVENPTFPTEPTPSWK
jgi:hypothetical protein